MMRPAVLLLVAALRPTCTFRADAGASIMRSAPLRSAAAAPAMVFGLNPPASSSGLFPPLFSPRSEVLYEGGTPIDFTLETLHLTKRRVSGGVLVRAPPEDIWSVITNYEAMPDVIPNILSNVVRRDAASGRVTIEQESLLSTRMNLVVSMQLEAVASPERWTLELRRTGGHGFLEFDAKYVLKPRGDGTTYLSYEVEMVPCPIFPLPLVERKIRKEVPKMLSAVGEAARERTSL